MGADTDTIAEPNDFRCRLLKWYEKHARPLPWRETRDPYAILVSEMMLQQTQVKTVLGYYSRFLSQFPTVESLAGADDQTVLAAWSGLGYYRRARLLHAAAQAIVTQHDGVVPQSTSELRRLPGVGRYTAGAVASFAYGAREPIVEANSERVLARLLALRGNVKSALNHSLLWSTAAKVVPRTNPRSFNYALMELGSLVCSPIPKCDICPVIRHCRAHKLGIAEQIPASVPQGEMTTVNYLVLALVKKNEVLFEKVTGDKWYHGMYQFPRVEVKRFPSRAAIFRSIANHLRELSLELNTDLHELATISHQVTRHKVSLRILLAQGTVCASAEQGRYIWLPLNEDLSHLPMSSPQKKIVTLLRQRLGFHKDDQR